MTQAQFGNRPDSVTQAEVLQFARANPASQRCCNSVVAFDSCFCDKGVQALISQYGLTQTVSLATQARLQCAWCMSRGMMIDDVSCIPAAGLFCQLRTERRPSFLLLDPIG